MISPAEIRALAEETGFPRVSLYMPAHRAGMEVRQGPIRLKNLLGDAAGLLKGKGMSPGEIQRLFKQILPHMESENAPFWQHQDLGLAVFISPVATRCLRVPLRFEEQVHVGSRFLVKPLLPMLARDGRFHVLAVSEDGARLFEASRYGMADAGNSRLSDSAADLLGRSEFENALGFHAAARGAANVQFHSLGESPQDERQRQVEEYARMVAAAADEILSGAGTPLVLAADDRMLGMLRNYLGYDGVVEDAIRAHPESLSGEALHEQAYDLVRDRLDRDRREAMERFEARRNDGGEGVASRIEEVVPAAAGGRVDALIVAVDAAAEGRFDAEKDRAVETGPDDEEAIDLVDFAVLQTLAHGGTVYSRPADRAEDFPPVGAIYRY